MESIYENEILKNGKKLNVLVIGGSGASGRELIDHMLENPNYESITILSRRKIERWTSLTESQKKKFIYVEIKDLDFLDLEKNPELYKQIIPQTHTQYDTLFCCLGSRSARPDFRQVDHDYVIATSKIAEFYKIQHFSMVSAQHSKSDSWFNYLKTKGEAEDEVMKRELQCISIIRPGIITDRDESTTGEKIGKYLPFFDKITAKDLGLAIRNIDLNVHLKNANIKKQWEHKELENMANQTGGCC